MRSSAEHAVTVHTGIVELVGGVADEFLIPGLRRFICRFAGVGEFHGELYPVGIGYRNSPAVFAFAAWRQHEGCRFREGHGRIVDDVPTGINPKAPSKTIQSGLT